jgi:hypothetical protein
MARMKTSRLVTVAAVFILAGTEADAQFRRGLPASATEINLFPVVPPALLLPAGSFHVEVKNLSTAPDRLLSRLDDAITTQMSDNDRRLEAVESNGQMRVVATLTEWTLTRRHGTRFVPAVRLVGTEQLRDGNGTSIAEPVYDYGRNKPNVVDNGVATVRVEVRRGTEVLADETARITYQSDRLVEEGTPSITDIENALIDRAAQKSAGLVTAAREPVKVPLARSDEVERLNNLAVNRWWNEWRAALQERPSHRDAKRDAYRLHNLGVALEAMAYEATTDDDALRLLQDAAGVVQQAMAARKDEKYFAESFARISNNSAGYTRLKTMRAAISAR